MYLKSNMVGKQLLKKVSVIMNTLDFMEGLITMIVLVGGAIGSFSAGPLVYSNYEYLDWIWEEKSITLHEHSYSGRM
jgi:hypothetical protein